MATKTAAKIGEGDRVIRRSASVHAHYRHQGPLVGEVVEELPDGALMVRWPRAVTVRGRKTTQSAQKPGSLWLATDENVAKIQRRTWLGMAKRYAEGVERYERRADAIDARGGTGGALERNAAEQFRVRLREVERRLEGQGTTEPPRQAAVVERRGR